MGEEFQSFLHKCPDYRLTREYFHETMAKAVPGRNLRRWTKYMNSIFDSTGHGSINFVMFIFIFHIMGDGTPHEVMFRMFRVYDVDRKGKINKTERDMMVKVILSLLYIDPEQRLEEAYKFSLGLHHETTDMNEFINVCLNHNGFKEMLISKDVNEFDEGDSLEINEVDDVEVCDFYDL